MKKILCFLLILGLLYTCYAATDGFFANSVFYKGDLLFKLDKSSYSAGDDLKTSIMVSNMENFPLVDCSLVVNVVKGGVNHSYPSQLSDADNVVYEKVITGINLAAKSEKTIPFSYKIPEDASSGNYRLEVYFKNERAPIVGMAHIFMAPKHVSFNVGGVGEFPQVQILRTTTVFGEQTGPVGAQVNESSKIQGVVYVRSNSNSELRNLALQVIVCSWDDTTCKTGDYIFNKTYVIDSMPANATTGISVNFSSPDKPDAYAIRLELLDAKNRTVSLYRNRLISTGETAKVRKLVINKLYLEKGQNNTVQALIGASPDHYTNPVVKNAKLFVNVSSQTKEIFSGSFVIPELSAQKPFVEKAFSFVPADNFAEYSVCAKIDSAEGKPYDNYCFTVSPEKTVVGINVVTADWSYNPVKKALDVTLCAKDVSNLASNAVVSSILYQKKDDSLIKFSENINLAPCSSASYNVGEGDYLLVVNEVSTNKQYRFDVGTNEKIVVPAVCGNGKCEQGEDKGNCCSDCGCPRGLVCESNKCASVETGTTSPKEITTTTNAEPTNSNDSSNLLVFLGVIILLIGVGYYFMVKRR